MINIEPTDGTLYIENFRWKFTYCQRVSLPTYLLNLVLISRLHSKEVVIEKENFVFVFSLIFILIFYSPRTIFFLFLLRSCLPFLLLPHLSLSLSLSLSLFLLPSIYVFVFLSQSFRIYLNLFISIYLLIHIDIYMCVCGYICLSIYLSIWYNPP